MRNLGSMMVFVKTERVRGFRIIYIWSARTCWAIYGRLGFARCWGM